VLDVGHLDDRRLGLPVEVAAERQQGVAHHLDRDAVLDLVLGAGLQLGGELRVELGVAGGAGRCRRAGATARRRRRPPTSSSGEAPMKPSIEKR
jgi:hypothetical protein